MVDTHTRTQRSANMRAIRSRDTKPELQVRRVLYGLGYRFRSCFRILGFRPDVVFTRRRKAVFIHGCFWHRHAGCRYAPTPATRPEFWAEKFRRNIDRDRRALETLEHNGWTCMTVWGCELGDPVALEESLKSFLGPPRW